MVIFQAQAGMAALHRLHGRDDAAVEAATEALELYRAGGFRRFRNRVDPTADLRRAAACAATVLAVVAAERAAGTTRPLLGQADACARHRRRSPGSATTSSSPRGGDRCARP